MTYRGVYQNGMVFFEGEVGLRNGDRVDVNPSRKAGRRSSTKAKAKARGGKKPAAVHPLIALAGIWKDRPDWRGKSSVEVVAELRKSTSPSRRARRARG